MTELLTTNFNWPRQFTYIPQTYTYGTYSGNTPSLTFGMSYNLRPLLNNTGIYGINLGTSVGDDLIKLSMHLVTPSMPKSKEIQIESNFDPSSLQGIDYFKWKFQNDNKDLINSMTLEEYKAFADNWKYALEESNYDYDYAMLFANAIRLGKPLPLAPISAVPDWLGGSKKTEPVEPNFLDKVGDWWHNFWNKEYNMTAIPEEPDDYDGNDFEHTTKPLITSALLKAGVKVDESKILPLKLTLKDAAGEKLTGITIATLPASVAISGPLATGLTFTGATVGGLGGNYVGRELAEGFGLNSNALEMFGDVLGFGGALLTGGATGKGFYLNKGDQFPELSSTDKFFSLIGKEKPQSPLTTGISPYFNRPGTFGYNMREALRLAGVETDFISDSDLRLFRDLRLNSILQLAKNEGIERLAITGKDNASVLYDVNSGLEIGSLNFNSMSPLEHAETYWQPEWPEIQWVVDPSNYRVPGMIKKINYADGTAPTNTSGQLYYSSLIDMNLLNPEFAGIASGNLLLDPIPTEVVTLPSRFLLILLSPNGGIHRLFGNIPGFPIIGLLKVMPGSKYIIPVKNNFHFDIKPILDNNSFKVNLAPGSNVRRKYGGKLIKRNK